MARPPIPEHIRDLTLEIFEELTVARGRMPNGEGVLAVLWKRMEAKGWPDPVPTLRWVQKVLEGPRKLARMKSDVDVPWSLAAYREKPGLITDDQAGMLSEMYAYCLARNLPFTIRHASWVSRLKHIVRAGGSGHPDAPVDHATLHYWSTRYAARERTAELSGQAMVTSDLDVLITMPGEVYATLSGLRKFPLWDLSAVIEDLTHAPEQLAAATLGVPGVWNKGKSELRDRIRSKIADLSPERQHVAGELFEIWVAELSGPSPNGVETIADQVNIWNRLLDEVIEAANDVGWGPWFDEAISVPLWQWDADTLRDLGPFQGWVPSDELLRDAGYPIPRHESG